MYVPRYLNSFLSGSISISSSFSLSLHTTITTNIINNNVEYCVFTNCESARRESRSRRRSTMKVLSPKLFTLSILLAALVLASAHAVSDNEMQKHEATESRGVVEEEKVQVQSLKNSSMAERSGSALNEHAVDNPEEIASMVDESIRNYTARRNLNFFSCGTGNPIDDCWRCDKRWYARRKRLANCGIGFGRNAIGGRDGRYYVVSDPGDDDPVNPKPGTLRHAVIQDRPLWIVFKRDMVITLKQELIMNSFKTIDGRGVNVHIAYGACITIQFVTNVIIHGLHIHDCKVTGNAMVRSSPGHYGWRTLADGDGISIFGSSHIWIDHNSLSNCADGLVDAIMGSTAITISNNYFTHHNEVMLLGHSDSYVRDKQMQVTIAYNHFGEGLIQRMPRCRHGYFHVVNNDYTHWEMYAIGGSANPTINSQGNRYLAPLNPFAKEVTKRVDTGSSVWKSWNWRSEGDLLLNGAFFTSSGAGAAASYARASSLGAKSSSLVGTITSGAGVLNCRRGVMC